MYKKNIPAFFLFLLFIFLIETAFGAGQILIRKVALSITGEAVESANTFLEDYSGKISVQANFEEIKTSNNSF